MASGLAFAFLTLTVLATIGATAGRTPASAEEPTGLILADTPGGEPIGENFVVAVRSAATSTSRTMFLRPKGRPPETVNVFADADDLTVTFTGGQGTPSPTLDVDLSNGEVVVIVTVTGDSGGQAAVLARTPGGTIRLGSLSVGAVHVAGGTAEGIKVDSRSLPFAHPVDIYAGNAPVKGLSVTMEPFRSDTGEEAEVTINAPTPSPVNLDKYGRATFVVEGSLPLSGTWQSALRISHDGVVDAPLALTVIRSRAPSSVQIESTTLARVDTPLNGPASVTRIVTIRETTGRTVTLARPHLLSLTRTDGQTQLEEEGKIASISDDAGTDFSQDKDITVEGDESLRLRVALELPERPAEYSYKLRFEEPGAQPTDVSFTTTVRRPPWWPTLAIVGGLVLSLILRLVWAERLSRNAARLPFAYLNQAFDRMSARLGPLSPEEVDIVSGLAGAIEEADREAATGDQVDAAKRAEALNLLLPACEAWVRLSRRVTDGPESLRPRFRAALADLAGQFGEAGREETIASGMDTAIDGVKRDYDQAVNELVKGEIDKFRAEAAVVTTSGGTRVTAYLDEANAALEASRPDEASRLLVKAQGEAARLLATQVKTQIAAGPDPAPGLSEAEWDIAVALVKQLLDEAEAEPDPEKAFARFQEADRRLLTAALGALRRQAMSRIGGLEGKQSRTQKEDAELTLSRDLLTRINAASGLVATKPSEAAAELAALIEEERQPSATRAARNASRMAHLALGWSLGPLASSVPRGTPASPTFRTVTVGALRKERRLLELLALVVAGMVALPLGLNYLYSTNYTWGSLRDVLGAFIWGLGSHQLSGQAFTGITGLRQHLLGQPAAT